VLRHVLEEGVWVVCPDVTVVFRLDIAETVYKSGIAVETVDVYVHFYGKQVETLL
jgi:hypothetical protein